MEPQTTLDESIARDEQWFQAGEQQCSKTVKEVANPNNDTTTEKTNCASEPTECMTIFVTLLFLLT
jgi:hypothetical protein